MDNQPGDLDALLQETLGDWIDQGVLPADKSAQLESRIRNMARQDRKNRAVNRLYGLALAIATCIWLLFVNCPVAAASYAGDSNTPHLVLFNALILLTVLSGYLFKMAIHSPFCVSLEEG